jgi:hypothetical protein
MALPIPANAEIRMTTDTKMKGPASYVPSIETHNGHAVAHRFRILDPLKAEKHMEQIAYLKEHYKMGHGHANALARLSPGPAIQLSSLCRARHDLASP